VDFTLSRASLVAALTGPASVADKRPTSPIMAAVLVQARGDGLTLTATDKAVTLAAQHPAAVQTPGEAAIGVSDFLNVVKNLAEGPVRVRLVENGRIQVTAGQSVFKLNAFPAADFPVMPQIAGAKAVTFAGADLRRMIAQTIADVADEDNRYGLNGVHVETVGDGILRFVGTDGNRLGYSEGPYTGEFAMGRKLMLPRKALLEMRKLCEGVAGTVELGFLDRAAVFRAGPVVLHARLLEADFPDYRQVLPSTFKRRILLDRAVFAEAVKRVAIFATDGARSVRFAFAADELVMTARKLDAGDSREQIPADITGEPITMGFNSRFVLDALATMAGPRVALDLGDTLSPAKLTDPDDARAVAIIMPVRLD
jgi:DNA polymerase-3 subunit beta